MSENGWEFQMSQVSVRYRPVANPLKVLKPIKKECFDGKQHLPARGRTSLAEKAKRRCKKCKNGQILGLVTLEFNSNWSFAFGSVAQRSANQRK